MINKEIQCSQEIVEYHHHDLNHKIEFLAKLDKLSTIDLEFTYNFCVNNKK